MPRMQSYLPFFLISLGVNYLVNGQDQNVQFNQVANLNGDMQLNRLIFPDNSKIETFSQSQRQVLVNQNPAPLTANHVVGSTGQPFVQLSPNSMTISTNGATDLVAAQIELPINQATLDQNGITADNTFVAKLSSDGQAWIVMEGIKSVNTTDSTVRLVKMNSIDGEYMAIGRKSVETGNVLTPFGTQQSVNITGSGIQEVEFADGFRMSIKANMPMSINTDVVNGVSTSMLTQNVMPVNNYRYLVTTNLAGVIPNLNRMMTVVELPLNANKVMQTALSMGVGMNASVSLGIAQRGVLRNPGGATQGGLSPQPQKRQKRATTSSKSTRAVASTKISTSTAIAASVTEAAANATGTEATGTVEDASASNAEATSSSVVSAESAPAESAPSSGSPAAADAAPTEPASNPQPANIPPQNPAATQLLLSPTFTPITAPTVLDTTNNRIAVPVSQLDGEYILTIGKSTAGITQSETGQNQNGITITMAELQNMAQQQQNGGVMPVWHMMQDFLSQNQNPQGQSQARARAVRQRRPVAYP